MPSERFARDTEKALQQKAIDIYLPKFFEFLSLFYEENHHEIYYQPRSPFGFFATNR